MRLAFIYKKDATINAQYRALMPMTMLQKRGHEVVWWGSSEDRLPVERLRDCDLFTPIAPPPQIYSRCWIHFVAAALGSAGTTYDDISAVSQHSPSYERLGGLKGQRDFSRQARAMRMADLVMTASRALAERF